MRDRMFKRIIRAMCLCVALIAIISMSTIVDVGTRSVAVNIPDSNEQVKITGIKREALPNNVSLDVKDVTEMMPGEVAAEIAELNSWNVTQMNIQDLDIRLIDEKNNEVQPNGTVTVSVPIPQGFDRESLCLYYIGDGTEKPTEVAFEVVDNNIVFERNHFCQFCIVAENVAAGEDGSANIGWYVKNAQADTFYLTTGADLRGLSKLLSDSRIYFELETGKVVSSSGDGINEATRSNFEGKRIVLLNDIEMNSTSFEAIGSSEYAFKGIFDGNGYTIKNLNAVSGLFYYNEGEIRNLAMENAYVLTNTGSGGIIVAENKGAIYNCYVYSSTLASGATTTLGGITGTNSTAGIVSNCYVADMTFSASYATKSMAIGAGYDAGTCNNIYIDSVSANANDADYYTQVTSDVVESTAEDGLAAILTANIQSLPHGDAVQPETIYTAYSVNQSHPVFSNHLDASYIEINAGVVVNGEVNDTLQFVAVNGGEYVNTDKARMYNGYAGPLLIARASTNDYTFKGWYDNAEGTGTALTKELEYRVTNYSAITYYAVYTGGPYKVTLVAEKHNDADYLGTVASSGQEGYEVTVEVSRGSSVDIYATGIEGMAFKGWYYVDGEGNVGTNPASTSRAENAKYTFTPKEDVKLLAKFVEGVTVKTKYTIDSTSAMGTMSQSASAVERGESITVSAASKMGYEFEGWYSGETGSADTLLSNDVSYTFEIPTDYSTYIYDIYARFVPAGNPYIESTGSNGIVMVKDPGNVVSKVYYQYAGTTEFVWVENNYWNFFCANGQGKDFNGDVKADYASNSQAYSWNGGLGYKTHASAITTSGIVLEYEGWHTFIFMHKDGSHSYVNFYLTSEMLAGEQILPSVTNKYSTITIHDNGSGITQVLYQLTSLDTSATTCPKLYTSWGKFVENGCNEDVLEENGSDGYKSLSNKTPFDGREIVVSKAGWYTFFIRYDNSQLRFIYIKITEADIEDGKGAQLTQHINYTFSSKAVMGFEVRTPAIEDATNYGIKFEDPNGNATYAMQYGTYRGRTYFVYNYSLTANTKYKLTPVALVGGAYKTIGKEKSFTTAKATVATTANANYFANSTTGIGYRNANYSGNAIGVLDMHGAGGIRTTFGDGCWKLYCADNTTANQFSPSDNVTVIPSETIIKGASGTEYVQMKYTLRNNTTSTVTGYKFAICADTQIGSVDAAPIRRTAFGITMSDDSNNTLALIANESSNVDGLVGKSTTASTVWFGRYSGNNPSSVTDISGSGSSSYTEMRYKNQTLSSVSGVDSAMAVSWQNITLQAGEVRDYMIIMGVVGDGVLTVPETKPSVGVNEDGQIEIDSNSTSQSENVFTTVDYAYVSDNVSATSCPFTTSDVDALRVQGLNYRNINGKDGYGIISGKLIEEGENQNNLIDYHEPGWYELLINYETRTYQDPSDTSKYTKVEHTLPLYVRITEDDLRGVPLVNKDGHKIIVRNNNSSLQTAFYQLSDNENVEFQDELLFDGYDVNTDWYKFVQRGKNFVQTNTDSGYKGDNVDWSDATKTSTTYVVTTPGWYTVRLKYKSADGTQDKFLYKYLYFSESDVAIAGPQIDKTYNVVTINDNESDVKSVEYQLSSLDISLSETAFLADYEYGKGSHYTTVGTNLYKVSNDTTNAEIFQRIGVYSSAADYHAAEMNPALVGENTDEGYKHYKISDGATLTLEHSGWYTIRIQYGDGYWVNKYILVTEEDVSQVPIATMDQDTGILTMSANGFNVREVYIQYTCAYTNGESDIPIDSRYATDLGWSKVWSKYVEKGQAVTTNGINDFNGTDGYKKLNIGSDTDSYVSIALNYSGWYTVYIKYSGGTRLQYIALHDDIQGPELYQYQGSEPVNGSTDISDYRMMITYKDFITDDTRPIQKYSYGYIGTEAPANPIRSWYGMSSACGGDKNTVTSEVPITATESGRTFNMVVTKTGYYAVMVKDYYYGEKYYVVNVQNDVTVRTVVDHNTPQLKVTGKELRAVKDSGSAVYIKESTDTEYLRTDAIKLISGGLKTIDVIDESGRIYEVHANISNDIVDKEELYAKLDTLSKYYSKTQPVADELFDTCTDVGTWTKQTIYDTLQPVITEANVLYENATANQIQVDNMVKTLNTTIKKYQDNTKTIDPPLVTVDGDTITVNIPSDAEFKYMIYCIEKRTNITTGYKPPKSTIWQDWTGVSTEEYYRFTALKNNTYVLTNVPDGVYTFQIKLDNDVYFCNPIVSATTGSDVTVAKAFLVDPADETKGIIAEVETLYRSIRKESDHQTPYVKDSLYNELESKIAYAKALCEEITTDTEERASELVDMVASLKALIRKVNGAIITASEANITNISTVDATAGQYKAENLSGKLVCLFTARGNHANWNSFATVDFSKEKIEAQEDGSKTADITVNGNGDYTVYAKYEDGSYEFVHFTSEGYTGFPLQVERSGGKILVTIPSEYVGVVNKLAYIGEVSLKYSEDKYTDFADFTNNGGNQIASGDLLGVKDHTIYADIDGVKYYTTISIGTIPFVKVYSIDTTDGYGALIEACTVDGTVDRVAYASGSYSTWAEMEAAGVHYIAQNDKISIAAWTSLDDVYTVCFKGKGDYPDYIITVSGVGIASN